MILQLLIQPNKNGTDEMDITICVSSEKDIFIASQILLYGAYGASYESCIKSVYYATMNTLELYMYRNELEECR